MVQAQTSRLATLEQHMRAAGLLSELALLGDEALDEEEEKEELEAWDGGHGGSAAKGQQLLKLGESPSPLTGLGMRTDGSAKKR